ncbi:hypothetical protein AGMMS50268_31630 [Spirochaetia bacterium]|nr:hypothetical protein AGMMS50268_31630 [Spirochaetia bacterium]
MPTVKTATKKTSKTVKASIGRQKPIQKPVKKVTLDDVWETIREIGKAHKELEKAHKETEKALKENQKMVGEVQKAQKETQRIVSGLGASHEETEAGFRELQKAQKEAQRIVSGLGASHEETEKAMKETQRIVGDLGNKFGDEAEYTMIPGLPEKFKQFGFDFGAISRNRKINNDKHDIHAEIDAFLENGTQAMAVEVKAKLQTGDVDDHIKRMEKIRKHADIVGDKRELFGALAATIVQDKPRDYALENGFYVIEPSGEDVKVIKPGSEPRVW